MKTLLRALLVFVAVAAAAGCSKSGGAGGAKLLMKGELAPDFTALRSDNTPVKLSDFRGKMVLLDFWATWCGPCKVSMPFMEEMHTRLKDQGVVVLGVCVWDEREKFDAWMAKPEVPTSYLKVFDPKGETADNVASSLFNVSGIPTFYLISPEGKVLFAGVGAGPSMEAALFEALSATGLKL